jgi:hypothetical protein
MSFHAKEVAGAKSTLSIIWGFVVRIGRAKIFQRVLILLLSLRRWAIWIIRWIFLAVFCRLEFALSLEFLLLVRGII